MKAEGVYGVYQVNSPALQKLHHHTGSTTTTAYWIQISELHLQALHKDICPCKAVLLWHSKHYPNHRD
jgi:hypothetical protein